MTPRIAGWILGGSVALLALGVGLWLFLAPLHRSKPQEALTAEGNVPPKEVQEGMIALPEPRRAGGMPLSEALQRRRSIREYTYEPLSLEELSQILWAAQGITDPRGYRTAPSAGARYPLEVYVVVGNVIGLAPGLYRYETKAHALALVREGDVRQPLASASLGQAWVKEGAVTLVFAADFARTTSRYGQRGYQYVYIEVGHAAQNVYLQATALGLGTVAVGAFEDERVSDVLELPKPLHPVYLMPIGRPAQP